MNPNPLTTDRRLIAAARTMLFNYGQGYRSPFQAYRENCSLLLISPALSPIPQYARLHLPFSFFSKAIHWEWQEREFPFMLFNPQTEGRAFHAQASVVKLNWMRNFYWMQELLFNFDGIEHAMILSILEHWNRPSYDYDKLPFCAARQTANNESLGAERQVRSRYLAAVRRREAREQSEASSSDIV